MDAKYTPGPWSVFIDDSGGQWTGWPLSITSDADVNDNGDGKLVVRTGGQWPYAWDYGTSQREAVANARLIASAPDLLEALTALYASYKALADSGDAGNWRLEDTNEGQQTLAAIARATGEAS